jgi:multimeric flavodoxin WrbA
MFIFVLYDNLKLNDMKVLLVNGSQHFNGCTATALNEVASALNECGVETKLFWIGARPVNGCVNCRQCDETSQCVFTDEVNIFTQQAAEYDGFVFGSPVYYASPNGAFLAFLDRAFYSAGETMAFKPAAAVVSCRRGGASATFDVINKYFSINNMPVISSQYWNQVHGNTPDEVRQDLEGMQTMRTLGRNMAWILKCIEAGKKDGISRPELEPRVATNFIR